MNTYIYIHIYIYIYIYICIYMLPILSSFIYILSPSTFEFKDLDFLLINSLLVECITQYSTRNFSQVV